MARYSREMTNKISLLIKIIGLAAIALTFGLGAGYIFSNSSSNGEPPRKPEANLQGGDFTLTSSSGEVSLSDYKGKLILVYFGYTYCPDICPTSLTFMSNAFKKLSKEELEQIQGIFISVDPDRDTVEKLQQYAAYFHPKIVGITGKKDNIDAITKRYGAFYRMVDTGSAAGYSVDHSSSTILVGKDGKIKSFLKHGMTGEEMVKEIRAYF